MLDTVKLQVPLTEKQHLKILESAITQDAYQWVQYNPLSGDRRFVRLKGLAETDQDSYHRNILWDVPETYHNDETCLTVELSLPKLYYGDNIRLLHEPIKAIELLNTFLNQQFKFRGKQRLCHFDQWRIRRLDCCYCWKFPTEELARAFLDSLKKIDRFPYKKPTIRDTSISFTSGKSATYSAKFYLKLPEFKAHDEKEMRKAKRAESDIEFRKCLATGILRFEVTLRAKWLQRNEINTLKDVLYPTWRVIFDDELVKASLPFFNQKTSLAFLMQHHLSNASEKWQDIKDLPIESYFHDGLYVSAPEGIYTNGHLVYDHPGGGFTVEATQNRPERILQQMLEMFIGKDARMAIPDQVREKLLSHYKPVTAANLTAFWLYVQKFGSDEAKRIYGDRAYYYKKGQLRKAGVGLLERKDNTLLVGKDFFTNFALSIPSEHVGNQTDDFRDSQNLLNLATQHQSDRTDVG